MGIGRGSLHGRSTNDSRRWPRHVVHVEPALTAITDAQQPSLWLHHRRFEVRRGTPLCAGLGRTEGQLPRTVEVREPRSRRARVDEAERRRSRAAPSPGGSWFTAARRVLVSAGVAHGARCGQRPGVVAVREQAALALQPRVDGARHAHAEALYPAREGATVSRFGDEMQMVALHGEMHEAKAETLLALRERAAHTDGQRLRAQGRHAGREPQRDVQWIHERV
jgi:hypothetical protein